LLGEELELGDVPSEKENLPDEEKQAPEEKTPD
jgi:hypothetical protein